MVKNFKAVLTDSFKKCLFKDFDKNRIKKIIERMKDLEAAANEHLVHGGSDRSKLNQFGKTLNKAGHKDIYSLEIGTDRFLAKIIETPYDTYYVFYWGGSHEKYNNIIKNLDTNKLPEDNAKKEIAKATLAIDAIRNKATNQMIKKIDNSI